FDQALSRSGVELPDIVLARGYARLKAGHVAEAEKDAERAASLLPAGAEELLARAALARHRLDDAERHAQAARRARPQPSSDIRLAEVFVRRGDLATAERALDEAGRRAAELEMARVPGLLSGRADVLAREGRVGDAESAYRREIEAFPGNVLA